MSASFNDVALLPPWQEALRARCFHPFEPFTEFHRDEIEQSIPERFEDQVRKHALRPAVKTHDRELTYDHLNRAANRIAHAILGIRGERQEQVGLLCNQGAAAIAATLGALKAGKTYVPLDPGVPEARNRFILNDAEIRLILADNEELNVRPRFGWKGHHRSQHR